MTVVSWPQAVPFDPEGGAASRIWEGLLASVGSGPGLLFLVSGEAARYSGWGARAAVALADALATQQPVVLIDLHLDSPDLGELAPADAEGIADALLYGASLDHVVQRLPGHSFSFVPAGPLVPDVEEVLRHPDWSRLLHEAAHQNAVILAYAPWRARGLNVLLERANGLIFLGGNADARIASGYMPQEVNVLGVVAPIGQSRKPVGAQAVAPPETHETPETAEPEQVTVAPAPVLLPAVTREEVDVSTPEPLLATPLKRKLLLAVPVVALVAVAGVWLTWSALMRPEESAPSVVPPPEAAVPANPGEPIGEPLPFSVAIEAHPELATAAERVARLSQAAPGKGFYLAPILVDSVLYYRVMAGPVRDSAGAAALDKELLDKGYKTGPSTSWDIRSTPLAFLLGVFDSRSAAAHRLAALADQHIPAYILEVPYSSGVSRFHLYCGAYAGPGEADLMRQRLGDAGLEANLVERVGRTPS